MLSSQFQSIRNLEVILASQATWRSNILKQLRISHRCIKHQFKEPAYETGSLRDFVQQLALEKGRSIQENYPSALIISADQLIMLDGEVFYKSKTKEKAIAQLTKLNGRKHDLICAVAVIYKGQFKVRAQEAVLIMRTLSAQEIENYVERDKPWDCAGSYKIESLGASLFEEVRVKDPTAIVGLPVNLLVDILREFGFSLLL